MQQQSPLPSNETEHQEVLEGLVSLFSHQIQNEMTVVIARAELASVEHHDCELLMQHLAEIRSAAMRTAALSKSLLTSHTGIMSVTKLVTEQRQAG